MKEHELRLYILKSDLTSTEKLVLLGICLRLDWSTWKGQISAKQISGLVNITLRTSKRTIKALIDKKVIKRSSTRIGEHMNTAAFTEINLRYFTKNDTSVIEDTSAMNDTSVNNGEYITKNDTTPVSSMVNDSVINDTRNNSNNINTTFNQLEKPRFTIHEDGFRWGVGTQYPDFDPNRDYKH